MKIGGRVGFNKLDELESHFIGIDFPIELALPWTYNDLWLPIENEIDKVVAFFKKIEINILSIHATQGKISDEKFIHWGKKTTLIAEEFNIKDITVHPDNRKNHRGDYQHIAIANIKRIENETGAKNIFSVETFGGKNRILKPYEIISSGIPMTLDTAHIHDRNMILDIIDKYYNNIKTVHLSAIGKEEHHLPIDDFCISVVDKLKKLNWTGNIVLEYLPWFHYRVRSDIKMLSDYVFKNKKISMVPPDEKYKNYPERWGYNSDGS